jgi:hypothetical protein
MASNASVNGYDLQVSVPLPEQVGQHSWIGLLERQILAISDGIPEADDTILVLDVLPSECACLGAQFDGESLPHRPIVVRAEREFCR